MSTNDVPGANPDNQDTLAMGCWAEHNDGSPILVEAVEQDQVVFCMFDTSREPVMEYRTRMPEREFKKTFSWPNQDAVRWTWHDKSPFPWDKVIATFPDGAKFASANAIITAARRIAERLGIVGGAVSTGDMRVPPDVAKDLKDIVGRLQAALNRLPTA